MLQCTQLYVNGASYFIADMSQVVSVCSVSPDHRLILVQECYTSTHLTWVFRSLSLSLSLIQSVRLPLIGNPDFLCRHPARGAVLHAAQQGPTRRRRACPHAARVPLSRL